MNFNTISLVKSMGLDLEKILQLITDKGVTAYEIAQNTSLTEAGIGKIISGKTKRPPKEEHS